MVLVRAPSALSPTPCKGDVNGSEGQLRLRAPILLPGLWGGGGHGGSSIAQDALLQQTGK